MSSQSKNGGKLTGFAIIALRATIKALELNSGVNRSNGEYRYDIPKLTGPFTYRAWTESTGADGVKVIDWVPDALAVNRNDPEAAIPFPE